jgi:cold shock CspA family protein
MSELTGTIVLFNKVKLYGFIEPDGVKDADLFFHLDAYDGDGDPAIGDKVTFVAEPNPGRPGRQRARAVTPIQNSQTVPAPEHV